ncbi:MAG TPA: hypothetical protein VFL60_06710 [Gaiellaceae bacterium]|nr:hypothetical protein [Gaiellaceae bacterium]
MAVAAGLAAAVFTAPAGSAAWCSGSVSVAKARTSVGKVVRVKARVASAYYARASNGSPTFIDLQFAYPDSRRLTLVIWRENRGNFPSAPERMFRRGTLVCVRGVVGRYGGAAQIEVSAWNAPGRLIR